MWFLPVLAFHYYDKILEIYQLIRSKGLVWFMVSVHGQLSPLILDLWQSRISWWEVCGGAKLLISRQLGSKERVREGKGPMS